MTEFRGEVITVVSIHHAGNHPIILYFSVLTPKTM